MKEKHEIRKGGPRVATVRKLTFFMIITRKGSLIPKVFFGSAGHWINVVLTFVPIISNTED
jgi:hypothetical protein